MRPGQAKDPRTGVRAQVTDLGPREGARVPLALPAGSWAHTAGSAIVRFRCDELGRLKPAAVPLWGGRYKPHSSLRAMPADALLIMQAPPSTTAAVLPSARVSVSHGDAPQLGCRAGPGGPTA